MNYLILNGSPHKGNTWTLVEHAKNTILASDTDAQLKEIHLMEASIPFCTGCSNCFRKGRQFCPHANKVQAILDAMDWADGLIVCSTTFNMRETALLKNFFDHLCYLMHRPYFFTKKAFVITSVGGVGAKSTVKSIAATLQGIGYNRCYRFYKMTASWNYYQPADKTLKKLTNVSQKFCMDVQSKKLHSPNTTLLIPYNLFRGMGRYYVPGTEYESEDGIYWTAPDHIHSLYGAHVPLHIYQRLMGRVFYWIGKSAGKHRIVTYRK